MNKRITLIIGMLLFLGQAGRLKAQDTFRYVSDTIQTWTVPGCVTQITVRLWAGGGGSGAYMVGDQPGWIWYGVPSASGSYYEGVISGLSHGTVLDLYVPSGGRFRDTGATLGGGAGGWPGGGYGGYDSNGNVPPEVETGGGGGGYAAIQINGTYYVVAGAAGGSGSYAYLSTHGGSGGAPNGGNGGSAYFYAGYGGTISAGGAPGYSYNVCDTGTSGLAFKGGRGGSSLLCHDGDAGGGGGGGYYGGGGGGDYNGEGGGGGSSFPASTFNSGGITFTPISNIQGNVDSSNAVVPAPGSPPDTTIGMGGYDSINGGNGLIIIYTGVPGLTSAISSQTNPNCGICNGSITATDSGGSPPYTYSWLPTGQTSATATGLCAGSYTVTVTDSCGSTATGKCFTNLYTHCS